jgi:hypothetical protein
MTTAKRSRMTTKRKHRNTPRITAAERVDAYGELIFGPGFGGLLDGKYRAHLIKAFSAHARDTLARHRRREAQK